MPAMPISSPSRSLSASQPPGLAPARTAECYTLRLHDDDCSIRAVLVESIDCLFSAIDEAEPAHHDDPMQEPLLDQIDDQRVQFHGQLTAPPRARRRQKLVASRAVFHTVVRR